jgi:hypothetical protein
MDKIKAAHKTFVRALKDKYRYRRWAGSISRILETKRRYLP